MQFLKKSTRRLIATLIGLAILVIIVNCLEFASLWKFLGFRITAAVFAFAIFIVSARSKFRKQPVLAIVISVYVLFLCIMLAVSTGRH